VIRKKEEKTTGDAKNRNLVIIYLRIYFESKSFAIFAS
jgi:hypothetical protein